MKRMHHRLFPRAFGLACMLLGILPAAEATIHYQLNGLPGNFAGSAPNGRFSWYQDSKEGRVLHIELLDAASGKERAEFVASGKGNKYKDKTVYIGWKSRLNLPKSNQGTTCLMQGYAAGDRKIVHPFDLHANTQTNELLLFRHSGQGEDARSTLWKRTLPSSSTWFSIVLKVRYSSNASVGYVELWYNGTKQTLSNGSQQVKMQTWDGVDNNVHWGMYRRGPINGTGHHYMKNVRIASSYAEAVP